MKDIMMFVKTDKFIYILAIATIILIILYCINLIKLTKIKKEYKEFMKKLGQGKDIEEILNKHIDKINKTISKNDELEKFCIKLDSDIKNCIQKVRNI